jgi:hypothetical protein
MSQLTLAGFGISACLAFGASGCVRSYKPPTASEPHAVIKLRRVYETHAGQRLSESVFVAKDRAFQEHSPAAETTAPRNDAILVHPTPASLRVATVFSHQETKQVREQYFERVPYSEMESYNCGTYSSPRNCSRTVTKYRSEMKWRTVTKTVDVVDGQCERAVALAPVAGQVYLLQYTYHGSSQCHLTCFEQSSSGGAIRQTPCKPAPR